MSDLLSQHKIYLWPVGIFIAEADFLTFSMNSVGRYLFVDIEFSQRTVILRSAATKNLSLRMTNLGILRSRPPWRSLTPRFAALWAGGPTAMTLWVSWKRRGTIQPYIWGINPVIPRKPFLLGNILDWLTISIV